MLKNVSVMTESLKDFSTKSVRAIYLVSTPPILQRDMGHVMLTRQAIYIFRF